MTVKMPTKIPKNVEEIVLEYLEEKGFDGLVESDQECACMTTDLAPGDCLSGSCEPGHLTPCSCGEGHDYHIVTGEIDYEGEPPKCKDCPDRDECDSSGCSQPERRNLWKNRIKGITP